MCDRVCWSLALAVLVGASPAFAQAPAVGPLVLRLPPSAQTTALGGAWVAGRDQDVIFYNPAQLVGSRAGIDLSFTRFGPASHQGSIASTYAAGKMSLTLGWGVQFLTFSAPRDTSYPYPPDVVVASGDSSGFSSLFVVGGAVVFKGFRIGGAGKYVTDRIATPAGEVSTVPETPHAFLADLGVARDLWGGVAAASVQNLGHGETDDGVRFPLPKQVLAGWSMRRGVGPVDLGLYSQLAFRDNWTAPAGGLEVGYSWIEGYNVVARVGALRPETTTERPISLGVGITGDRLTIEYAVRFYDGGRASNGVTVRWR